MKYVVKDAEGEVVGQFETENLGPFEIVEEPPETEGGGGPGSED